MTSKIMLGAIIAIAFMAGTITTGTIADAERPETDPDKDGILEGIVSEVIGLLKDPTFGLKAIQDAITVVQSDVTDIKTETDKIPMIKSDVTNIKTQTTSINSDVTAIKTQTDKIPMIKSDVSTVKSDVTDIKTELASAPEPLTKFENFVATVSEFGSDTKQYTRDIDSTGPMIVEVCKRSGIGSGDFGNDNHQGEGIVMVKELPNGPQFAMSEEGVPECRTMGLNPSQSVRVILIADAGLIDIARVTADVSIRTTQGSTITLSDPIVTEIDD